jgi:hypothetical protein
VLDSTLQEPRRLDTWKVDGIIEFNYHKATDKKHACWNL